MKPKYNACQKHFVTTFVPLAFPRKPPTVVWQDEIAIYDWKSYYTPHLRIMTKISKWRAFQLVHSDRHEAVLFYKESILQEGPWKGVNDNCLGDGECAKVFFY